MKLRHPNSVAHVRLLVRAPWKRYVVAAFFVAYYACSLKLWSDTEKGLSFTSGQQDRKEPPKREMGQDMGPE
eukprot:Skav217209  [mRNA]  locus=scaffold143:145026:146332:- [translate_table: standard]